MKNKKEIDVFSEFEEEINGDWEIICRKVEREKEEKRYRIEREERLKNPKRPHIPNFEDFYKSLVEFGYGDAYDASRVHELMYMTRGMINPTGKPFPKSLIKIWEALCNEEIYEVFTSTCINCNRKYDITYEETSPVVGFLREYDVLNDIMIEHEMKIKRRSIYCPKCGQRMAIIANGKLVSISLVEDK